MKDFLSTTFLFQINRVQIQPVDKFFLLVGVVAVVIAAIAKLAAKFSSNAVNTKYLNKLFYVFGFLSLGEIIWYGARVQLVKFFGTHFVAMIIILIALVWLVAVLWKIFRHYRKEKQAWEKEQVRLKYLPK